MQTFSLGWPHLGALTLAPFVYHPIHWLDALLTTCACRVFAPHVGGATGPGAWHLGLEPVTRPV